MPVPVPVPVPEKGAEEFSKKDKARLYRIALRSATECAAIIDVSKLLRLNDETELEPARQLLLRIVSMLTRMAKSGTGTGTGTKATTFEQSAIRNP